MRLIRVFVLCLLPSIVGAQPVQPVEILHEFATSPSKPGGPLLQVPDGSFYGLMSDAIYRVATDGVVTIAARLEAGAGASGALVRGPDGTLYGTTQWGGDGGRGTVFRFDPATGEVRTLHAFIASREGVSPRYGLTLVGGFLYGVTTSTLFRVDASSGAITILYTFGEDGIEIASPSSPVTLGADGLLYGTVHNGPGFGLPASGAIYRLNPGTGALAVVHAFTDLISPEGRLLLGPDGRLFGSAGGPGFSGAGGIYRYAPATDSYDVLFVFPTSATVIGPGALTMTPDGSLYGATVGSSNVVPNLVSTIFRLVPGPGAYTYEALGTAGLADRPQLTLGNDGLLYGYAQESQGIGQGNGSVYRFNPAGPFALTELSNFWPAAGAGWAPTEPVFPGGTHAYGTTGRPGRGSIYQLNPATGVVDIVAGVPEAQKFLLASSRVATAPFAQGPMGLLYGTTSATPDSGAPGGGPDTGIVRFSPIGNVATRVFGGFPETPTRPPYIDSPMVHVPADDGFSGDLYFVRDGTVYRFNNNSLTLTVAGVGPNPGSFGFNRSTRLVLAGDGQLYVGINTSLEVGEVPISFQTTSRIFRVNRATNTLDLVATLGSSFGLSSLAAGPANQLYVGRSLGGPLDGSEILLLHPLTGMLSPLCAWPDGALQHMTVTANGTIVGVATGRPQRLLLCHPANGSSVRVLPATVADLVGPLVEAGGFLYGATFDAPIDVNSAGLPKSASRQPGGALIRLSLSGSALTLDSESDGLPNVWETAFGLDPFDGTGDDGASGDPDGDGRTNAQELADGTHPRGVLTRYFAEGATGPFFRTRIDIDNPNEGRPATVLLRFLTDTGARIPHDVVVPAGSRVSIDVATLAGLAHATFSTVVEADATIGVDRAMSWDASGYGSHLETGVTAPATTWYLAEGATSGPFTLFYLLQNPQATAVTATVRYLRPIGLPPITKSYTLPPNSRTTIAVDDEAPGLATTDVSAEITASAPIVVERAMYYSQPGQPFAAGHESAGVTAPALEWFLAEGATGAFFDLFLLLANPNPVPAAVQIEYLLPGGGTEVKNYVVFDNSRLTIFVDDEVIPLGSGHRPLANTAVSMIVRSTNNVPIVVERTMWWPGSTLTPNYWYESHNSPGATTTATRWLVPGGEVGGAAAAQTYVLIANPGATAGRARIWALTDSGRFLTSGEPMALPPKSRTNLPFVNNLGLGSGNVIGILVESVGTNPVPIVVEYATYSSPGGVTWAAGGAALASPLP